MLGGFFIVFERAVRRGGLGDVDLEGVDVGLGVGIGEGGQGKRGGRG